MATFHSHAFKRLIKLGQVMNYQADKTRTGVFFELRILGRDTG